VDSESYPCVRLPCLSSLSSSALPIVSMSMIFPAPSEPCPRCRCLPSPPETRLRISRGAKVLQSYRKFSVPPNFSQDFFPPEQRASLSDPLPKLRLPSFAVAKVALFPLSPNIFRSIFYAKTLSHYQSK
jgi:hypothetical protein